MLEIVDKIPVILNALPYILQGGVVTLITVIGSLALGFCIGLPLAVLQVYGPSFIRRIIGVYVWFFRGMPILLKDSALCFVLGTPEIMARTHFVASRTYEHLPLYITAGLLYFGITLVGVHLLRVLERKVHIPGYAVSGSM